MNFLVNPVYFIPQLTTLRPAVSHIQTQIHTLQNNILNSKQHHGVLCYLLIFSTVFFKVVVLINEINHFVY